MALINSFVGDDGMNIRNFVKEKRIYLGMSQKELAYGICCQSTICNFESGTKDLTCDTLFKICSRLGIELLSDTKSYEYTEFWKLDNYFYFEEHFKILDELYELENSKDNGSDFFFHKIYFYYGKYHLQFSEDFSQAYKYLLYSREFTPSKTSLIYKKVELFCWYCFSETSGTKNNTFVSSLFDFMQESIDYMEDEEFIEMIYLHQLLLFKKKCYKESSDVGEFGKRMLYRMNVRKYVEKILFLLIETDKILNRSGENVELIEISLGFARINKNKKIIDYLHNQ